MCTGIALAYSDFTLDQIEKHGLDCRVCERGGEREIQFLFQHPHPLLPVVLDGGLRFARWGTRKGESRVLPVSGWTWLASLEAGRWREAGAVEAIIPARLGLCRGVWYAIAEGIRGLAVEERGVLVAYMLVEPSSHYHEVMTRSKRMAVLVGERI